MASLRQLLSQLDPDQLRALGGQVMDTPNPQVLTPQNQQAITRPRTVSQLPPQATASIRDMMARQAQQPIGQPNTAINDAPQPMRQMQQTMNLPDETPFGSSGEPFRTDRPRRVEQRDTVADDDAYLRDVESGVKHGGWKAKVLQGLENLNQQFNDKPRGRTLREMQIAQGQGMLGRDMAVEKSRTASELSSLTPVQLEDGSTVMVPRRGAGKLASDQQRIGQMDAATKVRIDGLKSLDKRRRVQSAIQIYNSGGANNPATLSALSQALELPADLQAKFNAGEVVPQVDANGGVQLINKRDGSVVDTGVTSYETTKESGRNTRRDKNAVDAMERTRIIAASGAAKMGDIPTLEKNQAMLLTYADEKDEEAAELADDQTSGGKQKVAKLKDDATKFRLAAAEAGEVIAKARGAQSGSSPSGATKGRLSRATFIKNNPKATAGKSSQEIDAMIKGGGFQPTP